MSKDDNQPPMDRMITPVPSKLLAEIDEIRFSGRFLSRSHAVRTLIMEAIEARKNKSKENGGVK